MIASNRVGSARDLIDENNAGWSYEFGDVQELAMCMSRYLELDDSAWQEIEGMTQDVAARASPSHLATVLIELAGHKSEDS